MKIYFSGIGGFGLCPLANLALDAGFEVVGSDQKPNENTKILDARQISIDYKQDGIFLAKTNSNQPIDWFIYTSALPQDHPELEMARQLNLKISKRSDFTSWFVNQHQLKMIAISGTHGKTTTTAMLIWLFHKLKIPTSYIVGSNLSFGPIGRFDPNSRYFIYECDEYDKNFLHYHPEFSLIPSLDHDHVDIFPTKLDYQNAFAQFINQSQLVFMWQRDSFKQLASLKNIIFVDEQLNPELKLLGVHNRANAQLILELMANLPDLDFKQAELIKFLNQTPMPKRRFEPIRPNLISDYAHHPTEIKATLELAHEYAQQYHFDKVVVVYEPHQNDRQVQFRNDYATAFATADKIYWLPTYVARHKQKQVLTNYELTQSIPQATTSNFDQDLIDAIKQELAANNLVVLMSAGDLDNFVRQQFLD